MDEAEYWALHSRLLTGDPVAPAEACEAWLPVLVQHLSRAFRRTCPHLVQEAAERALLDYVRSPERFAHPNYLYHAARCDLSNLRRREARHRRGRVPVVELDGVAGKESSTQPLDALVRREQREWALAVAGDLRPVAELMFDGQRSTAVFADAMGLGSLPADEQERQVKRMKDRVAKRLQRGGADHGAA